jgi:hypothetical protein
MWLHREIVCSLCLDGAYAKSGYSFIQIEAIESKARWFFNLMTGSMPIALIL